MEKFLLQFLIFLGAAVIAVPLAKKFKLGSVLGYLIAGIAIGPFGFSLINDIEAVMHFTEFGVVLMLFLIGLELKPSMLWQMRTPIIGMGGSQVLISTLLIGAGIFVLLPWKQAIAVGMILALSSTAVTMQTLREKGLMKTSPGRSVFAVLLFQDLAVIPMFAILPMLAVTGAHHDGGGHGTLLFDINTLPTYLRLLAVFGAIVSVVVVGKYASRPVFRIIAATRVREVFVAAALALLIGTSLLMSLVGLSPALGAFLAGVVLADSEYRHELESDIEPFKGLLLGIFFISIGASLNFALINAKLPLIGSLVLALIVLKFLVLIVVSLLFRMPRNESWLFGISLAQSGEFGFVLFQFSRNNGVLPADITAILISVVAISMFIAPLMFIFYERVIAPRLEFSGRKRDDDEIEAHGSPVILVGFGRLGTDLGRLLISSGIKPTILDHDETNVDVLRKFGFTVYYGDATRLDLLESAGAAEARLIVIALDDHEKALELVGLVKKHYPQLKIAVNAQDRAAAYEFMNLGVDAIRRKTFGSALRLGQDAMNLLGVHPYESFRRMRLFRKHDEKNLAELYRVYRENHDEYVSMYRENENQLARLMTRDAEANTQEAVARAWIARDPDT